MSKVSVLNLPKDPGFLSCFVSDPGTSLVYIDIAALEPHVLTEFSQDRRLLSLYGPGAKVNDIYPFFGSSTSIFGAKIRQYYDPDNPTPEGIKAVKKNLGAERDILKIAVLGMGYGMSYRKLQEDLALKGFHVSLQEARSIWEDYWEFFAGIDRFKEKLLRQYRANNGYVINGRGRPLAIANDYTKDIVNRFVQSTGHDVLMHYILLINRRRKADKVFMRPWLVDEHDCTVWQVVDDQVDLAKQIFLECLDELNRTLGWGIRFRGSLKSGKNFSIKCDD